MTDYEDLTFLDPETVPSPDVGLLAVKASGRRKVRNRRLKALAPVATAAVAAIVAVAVIVPGSSSTAHITPAIPTETPTVSPTVPATTTAPAATTTAPATTTSPAVTSSAATESVLTIPTTPGTKLSDAATVSGCPTGTVLGTATIKSVQYQAVKAGYDYWVCATSGTTTVHQAVSGVYLQPFADGSYFAADSTGNVFAQLAPGQVTGVLVVLPSSSGIRMVWPGATPEGHPVGNVVVVRTEGAWSLQVAVNDCSPDCARGTSTVSYYGWSVQDGAFELQAGTQTLPTQSEVFASTLVVGAPADDVLVPYETSDGGFLVPDATQGIDATHDEVAWIIAAGSKPETLRAADVLFVDKNGVHTCGAEGTGPAEVTVAAGGTGELAVSCVVAAGGDLGPVISARYAPGGTVLATWNGAP